MKVASFSRAEPDSLCEGSELAAFAYKTTQRNWNNWKRKKKKKSHNQSLEEVALILLRGLQPTRWTLRGFSPPAPLNFFTWPRPGKSARQPARPLGAEAAPSRPPRSAPGSAPRTNRSRQHPQHRRGCAAARAGTAPRSPDASPG